VRKGYLPPYDPVPGADAWEQSGEEVTFEPVKKPFKK
jgi:hypothetical protein